MTAPRAIVFDFDGVLADTEGLHLAAFQDVFTMRGWALDRDTYVRDYLGLDDRDLVRTFTARHGCRLSALETEALLRDKARRFDARVASGRVLFPTAAATVARLGARYRLAIASGSLRGEILAILDANGLASAFAAVVGADDVAASKPAPDVYLKAVALLGVDAAQAVAIEDSPWGLQAAHAAGLRTIGLTTSYPAPVLRPADAIVATLDEVDAMLVEALLDGRPASPDAAW